MVFQPSSRLPGGHHVTNSCFYRPKPSSCQVELYPKNPESAFVLPPLSCICKVHSTSGHTAQRKGNLGAEWWRDKGWYCGVKLSHPWSTSASQLSCRGWELARQTQSWREVISLVKCWQNRLLGPRVLWAGVETWSLKIQSLISLTRCQAHLLLTNHKAPCWYILC